MIRPIAIVPLPNPAPLEMICASSNVEFEKCPLPDYWPWAHIGNAVLQRTNIFGLPTLGSFFKFELHLLTFLQALEAARLNR